MGIRRAQQTKFSCLYRILSPLDHPKRQGLDEDVTFQISVRFEILSGCLFPHCGLCSLLGLCVVDGHWGILQGEKKNFGIFFQQDWKEFTFPQSLEKGPRQVPPTGELDKLRGNMGGFSFIHPIAAPRLWRAVCIYASQDQNSHFFPGKVCVFQHGIIPFSVHPGLLYNSLCFTSSSLWNYKCDVSWLDGWYLIFPFRAPLSSCKNQAIHDPFYTFLFLTCYKKQSLLFLGAAQFSRLAGSNKKFLTL